MTHRAGGGEWAAATVPQSLLSILEQKHHGQNWNAKPETGVRENMGILNVFGVAGSPLGRSLESGLRNINSYSSS